MQHCLVDFLGDLIVPVLATDRFVTVAVLTCRFPGRSHRPSFSLGKAMSVGGWRSSQKPSFSFVDVVHSNGTAAELITFTGCPRLFGDRFTLSARIRAAPGLGFMDFMSWGNDVDLAGQRAREFSLRDGALEYGQWDGQRWCAVRTTEGLIADDLWHHVSVTKDDTEVVLYIDGCACARGNVDNCVGPHDVGENIYAARYRTPPGVHDWFWQGSIKHVHVHQTVLDPSEIYHQLLLTIVVEAKDMGMLKGHFTLSLSGQEFTMDFHEETTLEDLRFSLEVLFEGGSNIVLLTDQAVVLDQEMVQVRDLPGIYGSEH